MKYEISAVTGSNHIHYYKYVHIIKPNVLHLNKDFFYNPRLFATDGTDNDTRWLDSNPQPTALGGSRLYSLVSRTIST